MNTPRSCKALKLYTIFGADWYWRFAESCKLRRF
jgi:hypothetical protein